MLSTKKEKGSAVSYNPAGARRILSQAHRLLQIIRLKTSMTGCF